VTRLSAVGLGIVGILLLSSAQAGAMKPPPNVVKQTAQPVARVAMDWPRVAYASGGRVHVWNVATGRVSVVKGEYSNATHSIDAAQIAIAGTRVAWIKRQGFGNTEESEKLYTASIAGRAHVRKHAYLFNREDSAHAVGGWIAGVAGAGKVLAVSTWRSDKAVSSNERLTRITPTALRPVTTGPGAIVAQSVNNGRIAVLRSLAAWPADEPSTPTTEPTVGVYATDGTLLSEVVLDTPIPSPPSCGDCVSYPSTIQNSVALSDDELVVLTETNSWIDSSPSTTKIQVYDWRTGALLQTWPIAVRAYANTPPPLAAYGRFAVVEGQHKLLLLDLESGENAAIASTSGAGVAIGPRGLVYAAPRGARHGRLVFVQTARLPGLLG
jgi:hypothetical protein